MIKPTSIMPLKLLFAFLLLFVPATWLLSNPLKLVEKLSSLAYPEVPNINGKSAILISATDGSILYEKNIDEQIPPASLTKLMVFYTAFEIIAEKDIDINIQVPIPKKAYLSNLPPGSSNMNLGPDQKVTLKELFLGLAVASGNGAALAIAEFLSGSVEDFMVRMNENAHKIGMTKTVFIEPTGYDDKNLTTARDFGLFCYNYVKKYPEALKNYHSVKEFPYPKKQNLMRGNPTKTWTYRNRNNLLFNDYEDITIDGLKTGFIDESGYNIAASGIMNDYRLISVVLGNFSNDPQEGKRLRDKDASALLQYGFNNFEPLVIKIPEKFKQITSSVWLGDKKSVGLQPVSDISLTLPKNMGALYYKIIYKKDIVAPVDMQNPIGYIFIMTDTITLFKIPVYPSAGAIKKNGVSLLFAYIEFVFYKQFVLKDTDINDDFSLNLSN